MAQVYSQEVRDNIVRLRKDGLTYPQIAEELGIQHSSSLWRICATGGKTKGHFATDKQKDTVIRMFKDGASRQEIADAIGKSYSFVVAYINKCGCTRTDPNEELYAKMREYKAQGHTLKETAQHSNVSMGVVGTVCKGIAPQKPDMAEYTKRSNDNAEERLKQKLDDAFEYVGGYNGHDCYVTIRCKQCGAEFERSAQAIRKKQVRNCPCCRKEQTERNAEQREREREERRIMREAQEEIRRRERERKRQEAEQRRIENTVTKVCRMCGKEFDTVNKRQVFCSSECSHLWQNRRSYNRIPKDKRIDKGINALSLFKRDKGKCWICGGQCDTNDFITRNGVFIAGDWYPSVDHVKPICEGGADAWENVKLAHRICNSRRFYAEKTNPIA